jgi:hypothetical protein
MRNGRGAGSLSRLYLARFKQQNGDSYMPDSAVMTFTEPDAFHAAIRTAEVKGVVTVRGDYRAELTRIELHRLWMQRGGTMALWAQFPSERPVRIVVPPVWGLLGCGCSRGVGRWRRP